jgi:acyl carrier protein
MATVFERLREVIVEQLEVEQKEITPETSFTDDLNADSLDLVELITAIEEEFSLPGKRLEIADEDAEKIRTVQDAVDYLHSQGITDE